MVRSLAIRENLVETFSNEIANNIGKLKTRGAKAKVRRSSIERSRRTRDAANQGGQFAILAGNKLIFEALVGGGAAHLICVQSSRSKVGSFGGGESGHQVGVTA